APVPLADSDGAPQPLDLRGPEALAPVLVRNDGADPLFVCRTVVSSPLPSSAAGKPRASGISIERSWEKAAPGANNGFKAFDPADGVDQGETVRVTLAIVPDKTDGGAGATVRDAVVDEWLPAGLEPDLHSVSLLVPGRVPGSRNVAQCHVEIRDDRVIAFPSEIDGPVWLQYDAQAVSAGDYALPPAKVEAMYDPAVSAATAPSRFVVRPRR
ncbi:MAG: hypothetical protein IJ678_06915, partial [Kiritimatiellae bacterium]|nr:hypothetical protein [Kiritimatiellia bacterium]